MSLSEHRLISCALNSFCKSLPVVENVDNLSSLAPTEPGLGNRQCSYVVLVA